MEGDSSQRPTFEPADGQHSNELKLVNIDTSGDQASSPTCPLNLLVRSPLTNKTELELSDPFLISAGSRGGGGGGGGGGDRPVPTDELVDFREKGSREADDSGRGDDCDFDLLGEDAMELSGEADMDNIFQEALALADQFSQFNKIDDADVSLVDSAPQSLPGESELLSLDSAMLAALAEARRQPPPDQPPAPQDPPPPDLTPLDTSYPAPSSPFSVSSLRSASAAAVAQAAAVSAGGRTPPGTAPATAAASPRTSPTRRITEQPELDSKPAVDADGSVAPDATPSGSTSRQRDSPGRRLAAPTAPTAAPASAPAEPPPPADDAGYADLCQQASAEQRELELQADEEYENRQFEQLERRVSREDVLDVDSGPEFESELGEGSTQDIERDSTDSKRPGHPRSQLSRKETYICRPNTGTFRVDKRQRFGTYKVDKTGTFKVPRPSAAAARSLPPEPAPGGMNGAQETAPQESAADTPTSGVNGAEDVPSDSMNNTFCMYGDGYEEPSPGRGPLSASTPERDLPSAPVSAAGRRAAALRRPLTSTPCRSVGSSGGSIGLTPIRGPGAESRDEESPVPAPAAALRGAGLRQAAAAGVRQPGAAGGLRKPAASGLRQPAASGLRQPAASGLKQPAASGLKQPSASGLKQPSAPVSKQPTASGLRQPAASALRQPSSGLRPPSASGLRAPSAAGAPRSAPARQTAVQLRQSAAQSGSDSSVCSVRSLPGPNTSRSNPSLVADRSDVEPTLSQRQPRQLAGPGSRLPGRGGGVRRSAGGTGSLTNISLQATHSAGSSGLRRPAAGRSRHQETSKLSLSHQAASGERF